MCWYSVDAIFNSNDSTEMYWLSRLKCFILLFSVVWSVEKLKNKLYGMRDIYQQKVVSGYNWKVCKNKNYLVFNGEEIDNYRTYLILPLYLLWCNGFSLGPIRTYSVSLQLDIDNIRKITTRRWLKNKSIDK